MNSFTFQELIERGSLVLNDGYRTKGTELARDGIPILRVAEIGDGFLIPRSEDRIAENFRGAIGAKLSTVGDVLLTTKGTVGRRAIVPASGEGFAYSPQLCFFRIQDRSVDGRWLYYWLGGPEFWRQATSVSTQTDMAPYISLRDLRATRITLPPISEQRAIAATLGALDDKIESNRRAAEIARDLLDAMADEVAARLSTVPLRVIASLEKETVKPESMGETVVDHYSLPAFDDGERPKRTHASAIKSNKLRVRGRAILVSRLNPRTNRSWWVNSDDSVPSIASTEFAVLQAEEPLGLAGVWLAIRESSFRQELARRVTGTSGSHQRVRPDDMLDIEVPDSRELSNAELQRAENLLSLTDARRDESQRLAALRDALLPELLSGRILLPAAAATNRCRSGAVSKSLEG